MTTVIAIAVIEHAGSFLVGIRPDGVRLAGYAEFPGGKTEPGETPEEAAVRECLEETGLCVGAAETLHVAEDAAAMLRLHFIACRLCDESATPMEPFRWIPLAELAEHRFPPANARVVEQLLAKPHSPGDP